MDFLGFVRELGTLVVALLIVLDPIALLPIVVGVSAHLNDAERRMLTFKVVGGATILLLLFTFTGTWLLRLFGVTLNDLRIGGGLLLVIIALNLVVHGRLSSDHEDEYRAAIVPLISPMLTGPGAITAAVVFAAIHGVWITTLAALIAMFVCLLVFMASRFIHKLIGDSGTALVSRVMGVLIVAIGVSYMRIGILDLVDK
ncbi:MAG: MarC family protein [Armatimonadota bacterium]|nr:MarC family protein [bacterium]